MGRLSGKNKEVVETKRCKYAFDKGDEVCAKCNGMEIIHEGKTYKAEVACDAYEEEEVKTVVTAEVKEDAQNTALPPWEEETPVDTTEYVQRGVTTVIRAESGMSAEIRGRWYKFMFCEERILPEGADIEKEKELLWNAVHSSVDKQMEEVQTLN